MKLILAFFCLCFCIAQAAELVAHPAEQQRNHGESLWTCPGCGLKYPHCHKQCSNPPCPNYRKKR
ncbi:MAG: hypothetical protein K940chlam2_00815 [Chlamydiae bacterium]|nr:hypothetical protein [Chlamydiota bacterium]